MTAGVTSFAARWNPQRSLRRRPELTHPLWRNGVRGIRNVDDAVFSEIEYDPPYVEGFKPWIEARLGVSMGEMIQLRFDHSISMIAASKLLPGVQLSGSERGLNVYFKADCSASNFHPTTRPPSP